MSEEVEEVVNKLLSDFSQENHDLHQENRKLKRMVKSYMELNMSWIRDDEDEMEYYHQLCRELREEPLSSTL